MGEEPTELEGNESARSMEEEPAEPMGEEPTELEGNEPAGSMEEEPAEPVNKESKEGNTEGTEQ